MRIKLIRYGVAVLFGAALAAVYLLTRSFTGSEPPAERYRMLCDAFTIPGVLLMLTAALVALSNAGAFTGLGYATSHAIHMLIPGLGSRMETYADYVERKTEKGPVKGYGFIFHVGLAYFLLALVFLVLFYRNFQG
ncbi:MAG: DUF3899 domain-containing protein [Clostridia bacterium]